MALYGCITLIVACSSCIKKATKEETVCVLVGESA